jgi:putative PIN family toxin of toxin-antitoxin system
MSPARVVADSNVLVSAIYRGGKPKAIMDLAYAGTIELFLSRFILNEVRRVLRFKLKLASADVANALRGLRPFVIHPGPARLRVVRDPTDNRILECALAAQAEYLVTGDRDLLALGSYEAIAIVTPGEFLRRISP